MRAGVGGSVGWATYVKSYGTPEYTREDSVACPSRNELGITYEGAGNVAACAARCDAQRSLPR